MAANPGEVTNLYSVTYNSNNSTGGVTPATQTAESSSSTYTFLAPMGEDLVRIGYQFIGWSESAIATTAQYKPGGTISLSAATPNKTLYAVWQKAAFSGITAMSQMTTSICKGAEIGESKSLTDNSSGNDKSSYRVTKLKDGNCWMTENMSNSTGRARYDSTYGGYYTNESGESSGTITSSDAAKVCRHMGGDWSLPLSTYFVALMDGVNPSDATKAPYYFQYGGYYLNSNVGNAGSRGYYQSANAISADKAYILYVRSDQVDPSREDGRNGGFSVRCLVQGS